MASIIYQVEELDILNEIAEIVSEFALEEEFSKVYIQGYPQGWDFRDDCTDLFLQYFIIGFFIVHVVCQ